MPRLVNRPPSYRKHRASGKAVVTIDGRDVYLGPYGTATSRREYDRVIAEWLTSGRQSADADALSIVELAARFWKHAQAAYHRPRNDGGELACFKSVLRHLKNLYADTPVANFGPLQLRTVRDAFISVGWCRRHINRQTVRLRQIFKWGVAEGIVPPSVWHGLQAVSGLKAGKSAAHESEPVRPVPEHRIDATKVHLPPSICAMIDLQLLTGMRPGEVCSMRTGDIDTTGTLWTYRPERHKTQHHGVDRVIYLGPKAQVVLGPHLRSDLSAAVFSPADAMDWYREQRSARRHTPKSCGNRAGTNRKKKPKKTAGNQFETGSYRRAIEQATGKAYPLPGELAPTMVAGKRGDDDLVREPVKLWRQRLGEKGWAKVQAWRAAQHWHPNQLRHNAATRLRKEFGLEAAQVILGHRTLTVTQVYAEKNIAAAQKIMADVG